MAAAETTGTPARLVAAGTAVLGAAVLADSATEHYRGSFRDPFMVVPLAASGALLVGGVGRARGRDGRGTATRIGAIAAGLIGTAFHIWNVAKRPGGVSWNALFYAAPIGAPAALTLAGAAATAANALGENGGRIGPLAIASGRGIALATAASLAGTSLEAGLLHFRGAYHDPFMWAPVTLPPIAAAVLARDALAGEPSGAAKTLLGVTAALGILGMGFHAWGVHRGSGGWRNWRQNLLAGPPIPAPPAFTGLALIGWAAIMLMERRRG